MSSTAIFWTVTIMGVLWAPICHFAWHIEYENNDNSYNNNDNSYNNYENMENKK